MLASPVMWMFLLAGAGMMFVLMAAADRGGAVGTLPEAAAAEPTRPSASRSPHTIQPLHVRRGSAEAPRTRTFAFALHSDGMVLTGPPDLAVDELVYLEAGADSDPVRAAARVVAETPTGYKQVRFEERLATAPAT